MPPTCPPPKDTHCDYIPLHGKRDFPDVMKLRILRRGDCPALSGWDECNHKSHYKRETEESESENKTKAETERFEMLSMQLTLNMEGYKPGNVGELYGQKTARKQIFPLSLCKVLTALSTHFTLVNSRTFR